MRQDRDNSVYAYEYQTIALFVIMIIVCTIGVYYYPTIRGKIESNCNARGGSYLGGHCIISDYQECRKMVIEQPDPIVLLPKRCMRYVDRLAEEFFP